MATTLRRTPAEPTSEAATAGAAPAEGAPAGGSATEPATPSAAAPAAASAAADVAPIVERVGADCYIVIQNSITVGFIDVAGSVFVALRGSRYDQACEVGQSRDFETAVRYVCPDAAGTGGRYA